MLWSLAGFAPFAVGVLVFLGLWVLLSATASNSLWAKGAPTEVLAA